MAASWPVVGTEIPGVGTVVVERHIDVIIRRADGRDVCVPKAWLRSRNANPTGKVNAAAGRTS
jgi:hypothetical protein